MGDWVCYGDSRSDGDGKTGQRGRWRWERTGSLNLARFVALVCRFDVNQLEEMVLGTVRRVRRVQVYASHTSCARTSHDRGWKAREYLREGEMYLRKRNRGRCTDGTNVPRIVLNGFVPAKNICQISHRPRKKERLMRYARGDWWISVLMREKNHNWTMNWGVATYLITQQLFLVNELCTLTACDWAATRAGKIRYVMRYS
ncbi:hypothetical protein FGB62_133g015 [Gracilaria domingensis]|nr:hypothetical protein FGB62_133g015 [Gracilaria domingensis]